MTKQTTMKIKGGFYRRTYVRCSTVPYSGPAGTRHIEGSFQVFRGPRFPSALILLAHVCLKAAAAPSLMSAFSCLRGGGGLAKKWSKMDTQGVFH